MSAQDRGWGLPGCNSDQMSRVVVDGMVTSTPYFPLNVRRDVAPLFAELARWLVAERRRLGRSALTCSGGYNKRYISGTTTWSNHSWGLAADWNAGANPMQSTLRTDMPPGSGAKARSLGMVWGGDYGGRKDPMHFEFVGTPADARRLVAELNAPPAPAPPAPAPPAPAPPGDDDMDRMPELRRGSSGQMVKNLQGLLLAADRRLPVDGDFGPGTETVLREWQAAANAPGGADGIAGPGTWGRLLGLR